MAGVRCGLTLPSRTGEGVRWSTLAGVLALPGRPRGVDGPPPPRAEGGFGEAAGLGEAVLSLGVEGDDGRALDSGLGRDGRRSSGLRWQMAKGAVHAR